MKTIFLTKSQKQYEIILKVRVVTFTHGNHFVHLKSTDLTGRIQETKQTWHGVMGLSSRNESAPKTCIFYITSCILCIIIFTMCDTHAYYMEHAKDCETHTTYNTLNSEKHTTCNTLVIMRNISYVKY